MPFGIKSYHESLADLHVFCEKPRAYFIPYSNTESARLGVRDYSDNFISLIGVWDFAYFKNAEELPESSPAEDPEEQEDHSK